MKKALIHLANGFEEIEAITILDVLRRADIPALFISMSGSLEVTGAHGIIVKADNLFEKTDYTEAEILILPGGMPGSNNLNAHAGLKEQILKFHTKGQRIAAICAAPLVFGDLGILKGAEAVCFPGYESRLTGANVSYKPAVKSGHIIRVC